MLEHHIGWRFAGERQFPGEHLVQDNSQAVDVRTCVDGPRSGKSFGCKIRNALRCAVLRPTVADRIGRREIEYFHLRCCFGVGYKYAVGRQVAVDEIVLVRGVERLRYLPRYRDGPVDRELSAST